jgi:hypothetical protein
MAGLPMRQIQLFAAITVVTLFVIVDAMSADDRSAIPALARGSMVLTHYASAFAAAVAVCYVLFRILSEPPAPPKPPLPLLAAVFHIASGQLFEDIGQAIGRAIAIQLAYLQLFAVFSTIAFSSSLFARRRFRSAKWYALLNCPGMCLFIVFVIAAIVDFLEG